MTPFIPFPGTEINSFVSKSINEVITVFSDNLKNYRSEWLELAPDDVIYLQSEIDIIRKAKMPPEALKRLHEHKKLVMEYLRSPLGWESP